MDIMELGAIGELVGGAGVIVTLVYLALQIRHNTSATRAGNQRSALSAWAAVTAPLHSDPELSGLFAQALDNAEPLSREERIRVHYLLLHIVNFSWDQFVGWQAGIVDEPQVLAWERYIASVVAKPGGRSWWDSVRELYPEDFQMRFTQAIETVAPYDSLPFLRPEMEGL